MSAPIEPQGSALDELLSDEPLSAPARPSVLDSLRSSVGTDPTRYNQAVQEVPVNASPRFAAENPEWYEDRDLKKQARLIEERPRLRQSLERDPELVVGIGAGRIEQIARAHDTLQEETGLSEFFGQVAQTGRATVDQVAITASQYNRARLAHFEMADVATGSNFGGALNRQNMREIGREMGRRSQSMEGLSLAGQIVALGTGQAPHMFTGLASRAAAGAVLSSAGPVGTGVGLAAGGALPTVFIEEGNFFADGLETMPDVPKEDLLAMSVMVGLFNGSLELLPVESLAKTASGRFKRDAVRLLADRRFRDRAGYVLKRIAAQAMSESPVEALQEVPATLVPLVRQYINGEIGFEGIIEGIEESELFTRMGESARMGAIGSILPASMAVGVSSIGSRRRVEEAQSNREVFQKIADAAVDNREIIAEMPERYHQLMEEAIDENGQVEGIYINPEALIEAYEGEGAVEFAQLAENVPGLAERIELAEETGGKVRLTPAEFATYVAPSERFQKLADDLSFNEDQGSLRESFEATKPENIEKIKAQLTLLRESAGVDPERDVALEKDFVQNLSAIFDETIPAVSAPVREKNAQLLGRIVMQISEMDGSDPLEAMSDLLDRVQFEQRRELDSPGEVQRSGQVLREGGDPQVIGQDEGPPVAGEPMTIFDPAGNAQQVDVVEVSDQGSVLVRMPDGSEVVLDLAEQRSQNPTSPSYRVDGSGDAAIEGKPVSELTDEELASLTERAERRIAANVEAGSQSAALFDSLSDRNAALLERRRRDDSAPETFRQSVPEARVSTRRPTAKKSEEDALGEERLSVGISAVVDLGGDQLGKIATKIRGYTSLRPRQGESDIASVNRLKKIAKGNLRWLWDQVDEDTRERTRHWYIGANAVAEEWGIRYGHSTEAISGTIAAMSPQKDWFMNVSLAERVLDVMHHDQDISLTDEEIAAAIAREIEAKKAKPEVERDALLADFTRRMEALRGRTLATITDKVEAAMFVRARSQAIHDPNFRLVSPEGAFGDVVMGKEAAKRIAWGSYQEIGRAIEILRNPSREVISAELGDQHKVRSFFNNIVDPTNSDDVTIDTHAVAAALLKPLSGKGLEVGHNFGVGPGNSSVSGVQGTYAIWADAYRELAEEFGVLPRELQSVTWEAARSLFTAGFKSQSDNVEAAEEIWSRYNSGKLSAPKARERINDIAGGLEQPESALAPRESSGPRTSFAAGVAGARDVAGQSAGRPAGTAAGTAGRSPNRVLGRVGEAGQVEATRDATTVLKQDAADATNAAVDAFNRGDIGIFRQPAYHGSSSRFDKFSTDFMGTGEGAQAFGWGLYFSSSRGIAEFYRENLSSKQIRVGEDLVDGAGARLRPDGSLAPANQADEIVFARLRSKMNPFGGGSGVNDAAKAISEVRKDLIKSLEINAEDFEVSLSIRDQQIALDRMEEQGLEIIVSGQLFEVDIPEDNELMDWDASLSEQTPSVRAAIKSMPEAIGGLNDGLSQMTTEEISQMLYGIDPDGEFGQVDLDGEPITEEEWRDNLLESALSMDADGELTDFMFGDMDADGDQFGAGFYAQLATRLGSDRAASEALAAAGIKGHKYQANQISGGPGTATNFVIYEDAAISIAETFYSQSQEAKPSTRGQLIVDRRIQKFLLQLSEEKVNDSTLTHEIFHLALELVLDASERPGAGPEINEFREQILNFLNVDSREQIGRDQHERWAESGEVYMASGQAPTAELRNLFRFFFQRFKQVYRAIRDQLRNADPNNDFVPIFDRLLASEDQIRREANRDNVVAPMLAPELTELMTGPEEEELRRNLEAVNASERAKLESTIAKEDERILKAQMGELKTQVREEIYGRREHKLALWLRTGRTVTGDPIDDAIGLRVEGEHKMNGELLDEASGDVSTRKSLDGMVKVEGGLSPDAVAIAGGYNSTDEMLVELLAMEPSEDLIARIIHERAEVQGIVSTPEQLREAAAEKVDGQARDRLYAAQRRIARRLKGQMPAVDRVERKRLQGQAAPTVAEAKERVSAAQALLDESISQGADPGRIEGIQADIVAAEAGVVAAREARADQAQARRESRASRSKMPVQAIRAAARELVNELEFGQLKREMGRFKKMRAKASIAQTEAAVARDWDALEQAIDQEQLSNALAEEAAKRLEDVNKYKRLIESFDKPKSSKRARLSKHGDYEDEDGAVTNVMDVIDGLLSMVSFKNISLRKIERAPNVALFAKLVEDSNGIVLPLPNWVSDVLDRPNYKKMKVSDLEDLYVGIKALEKFGMDMVLEREGIEKVAEQEEVDALLGTLEQQKPVLWAGKNKFGESQRSKSAKVFGGIIGAQMSFESTADLLDDLNPEGNFNRFFMHRFKAAAREEERLRKLVSQKVNAAWDKYSPIEKREFYSKPIKIHSLGESLTKNEIMAIAANMGNPHNRAAVMDAKAYGLTEVQIEEILSHVTERDADYLQSVLDAVNLLWEPAAAAEKEMNGVVPPKVQGVPWTLPSGRVMKGGYFPLMFDPALAERSAEHQAREIGKGLMPAGGGAAMTKVGSLKARKRSSGGLTIRTDFHAVLQKHVNSMSKDIAWRNTIVKADRQLRKLAPELKRVLGEPFYRQMRNYLKRQGTTLREGDQGPPDFVIKTARQARKGLGLTVMAWRLTQAAIQWSGFVTAIPRVGAANIAWGWADVTSTVWNWDRITHYRELIPELKNRAETFDRDAQQETLRLKPIDIRRPFSSLDTIQAFSANVGYTLLGMIDTVTSTAVAAGAMHQAMSGQVEGIAANDVEASVRYAGKIIDRTQGSGGAVNAPSMLDGGEMMKLLTPMMSFVNAQTQQAIVYGALGMRQVGDPTAARSMIPGVPREAARFVSFWLWAYLMESLLSEGTRYMIKGLLGPDEPDEDAFFNTVLLRATLGPLGGVPVLREVETISRGFKPDTPLSSLSMTAYNATVKPAVDIVQGDYDGEKHIRALATGITYATGLPSKQALDAIEVLTQESFGRGR